MNNLNQHSYYYENLDVGESHNVFILSLPNEISWKLQRGPAVDGYFNINGQSTKELFTIDEAYDINDNSIRQIQT